MSLRQSDNPTYIIAEIGQNHNGDINIAKKIIDQLDRYPYDEITGDRFHRVDAIKLTKRDLTEELSKEGMEKLYEGKNSFGKTYGEHREFLELSYEQHVELGEYIKSKGFDFVETLCSVKTVKLLDMVKVDRIKVASRDLTNVPLMKALAQRPEPIILSTGMADEDDLNQALSILDEAGKTNVSILHCLSQYPAEYSNLNLQTIKWLQENKSQYVVGYSDHSLGTHIPVAATALGAKIIEKHVTLDRNMKGTDHPGSADIETFIDMVHHIRALELSMGEKIITRETSVEGAKIKLERSLATKRLIRAGEVLQESDVHMISPGDGLKWTDRNLIIGRAATKDIPTNTLLSTDMV
jgi:3-deoxy-D-glycero-D-galacto-nononate 9-phosphate synthase